MIEFSKSLRSFNGTLRGIDMLDSKLRGKVLNNVIPALDESPKVEAYIVNPYEITIRRRRKFSGILIRIKDRWILLNFIEYLEDSTHENLLYRNITKMVDLKSYIKLKNIHIISIDGIDEYVKSFSDAPYYNQVCAICKKYCGSRLKSHVKDYHSDVLDPEEYYDMYIKSDSESGTCKYCGCPTKLLGFTQGYRMFCSKSCHAKYKNTKRGER